MSSQRVELGDLRAGVAACRRHFIAGGIFSAILNVLYLAPTLYMLEVYDRVVPTRGVTTLILLSLVFLFAVATLSGLDAIRARLLVRASLRIDRIAAPRVIEALLARNDGVRTSQALRDFDLIRGALSGPGVLALFDAPWTPIYIVVCFLIHPLLGALALGGGLSLLVVAGLNERMTAGPIRGASEASSRAYSSLDQSAAQGGVVRALGMRRALVVRHLLERRRSSQMTAAANFAGTGYLTLTKFLRLLLQSLALGLGAYLAVEQKISAGSIFAASLLVTRSLGPIEQVVAAWRTFVQARAAWRNVNDLLASSPPDAPRTRLSTPSSRLAVEDLSVASPKKDRLLVQGVSFKLEPGEALAIVGPSGAGKSTLVRAIAGASPIQSGTVRFDGGSAEDWDSEHLSRHVGYAPQEPALFSGTIKENICRFSTLLEGRSDDLDAEAIAAANASGAHGFILRMEGAYDTMLGPFGAGLSAGQAQRLSLARALFRTPKVVIMDEPNAHLDAMGEADLLRTIEDLKARGVTVIVVAHRTGILAAMDKLLVMNDGRAAAFGPKDAVIKQMAITRNASPAELRRPDIVDA
ncbi:type I secretion system permease/ATPase [Caulobacter sp. S45]|uniref:type I secretion system permease/ATPase n=1 Tax=Caulobacter sp. S45 TaxID=1641861 RepID=UPI0015777929|nr:type I secretion system permease/ATPase [Caulobacter sp. S45]